ncbi:MAG: 2-iminoacetate synthase ThiH [Bacteroidales bacterium]|nr:2-iminoacetate synthase ThiH [Bacteroidales bacterium]
MFSEIAEKYNWDKIGDEINAKTKADVEHALHTPLLTMEDFKALVSPSAADYLEIMAKKSREATQKRFGKTIQFYIPLYLSNECSNHCIYCGFNHKNKISRITLNDKEILEEVKVIKKMGYEHILLLTGESPKHSGVDYLEHAMQLIRPYFKQITLEVQPMSTDEYKRLIAFGLHGVYVYQETYCKERYTLYHPAGKKKDYNWRIDTPDRLGIAGVHKIGLGALLGLENWRIEAVFMAMHLRYLEKTYWRTKYSIAFPRIRPHVGGFIPNYMVDDKEFAQMIWAFRIFDNDLEMSLTTRESQKFRNHMVELGITSMSAGSKTDPGGYTISDNELEQFTTNDNRNPKEMIQMIHNQGYDVIWKDWDACLEQKKYN